MSRSDEAGIVSIHEPVYALAKCHRVKTAPLLRFSGRFFAIRGGVAVGQ
jgi:hypothetical protein